ncbi:hypothetical protein B0H12DRAFT_1135346 [Mycena haematopus]|nr:hypothetical protein B0H12DRAFT_1135346 [Mycena haematopus]
MPSTGGVFLRSVRGSCGFGGGMLYGDGERAVGLGTGGDAPGGRPSWTISQRSSSWTVANWLWIGVLCVDDDGGGGGGLNSVAAFGFSRPNNFFIVDER